MHRTATVGLVGALILLLAGCAGRGMSGIVPPPQMNQPTQSTEQDQPVQPELWTKLTAELKRVLAERGITLDANGNPVGKTVSSLPKREYRTPDRFNDFPNDMARLTWVHYMQGDYDLNGEVNIGDLTPIGVYYGAKTGDPNWEQAMLADGDGNGEVNIADVTPIGQDFGAKLSGYVVQWRYGPDDDWSDYGFAPFDASQVQQSSGVMNYNAPSATGAYDFRVAPVGDSRQFTWITYQLDDNQSSYYDAVLAVNGGLPAIAYVDADGEALLYGVSKSSQPTSPGDWDIGVVDSSGVMPQPPQLRYFAGQPAIAYVGTDPTLFFDLRFARVLQLTPPTTSAQIHAIKHILPSNPPAFVYKDGLPIVGYGDGSTYKLYVSSVGEPSSETDWTEVDTGQEVDYASLALVANKVCSAGYKAADPSQLIFGRSLVEHPSGPLDFNRYNIDFIGATAEVPSIYAVGGLPRVVADNAQTTSVDFLGSTVINPSTMAMWSAHEVYTDPSDTLNPQLTLLDGRPAVCFGRTNLNLAWAMGEEPQQAADWLRANQIEGDANFNPYPPSMVEVEGLPIIAYTVYNPDDSSRHVYIAVAFEQ